MTNMTIKDALIVAKAADPSYYLLRMEYRRDNEPNEYAVCAALETLANTVVELQRENTELIDANIFDHQLAVASADKALKYDLDSVGIDQRFADAVELTELRAECIRLKSELVHYQNAVRMQSDELDRIVTAEDKARRLEANVARLHTLLLDLKHGLCWCELENHPNYLGLHSDRCNHIRSVFHETSPHNMNHSDIPREKAEQNMTHSDGEARPVHSALGSFRNVDEALQAAQEQEAASRLRPTAPFGPAFGDDWKDACTPAEVDILRDLNTVIIEALDASAEKGLDEEEDFRSLWIGLLLGSGHCTTFSGAYSWASFVRYHAKGLVA